MPESVVLPPFMPQGPMRHRHVQSVLASSPLRRAIIRRRARAFTRGSGDVLLDCGNGIRLHGYYTPSRPSRGIVIMIHGWEGSGESTYMLSAGMRLNACGYEVFRLHLRDHGPSHALNEELFHSNRIDEVVGAVADIEHRYPAQRRIVLGYSLGGNFALRVALRAPAAGIDLEQVIAVCPVLDPLRTLEELERGLWVYRYYFIKKWRRSLGIKQRHFPDRYDFEPFMQLDSLRDMTQRLVLEHTEYPDLLAYLRGYALVGPVLAPLSVPSHILFAADDPVCPAEDLQRIARPEMLAVTLTEHGGHCGYVQSMRLYSWADRFVVDRLAQPPPRPPAARSAPGGPGRRQACAAPDGRSRPAGAGIDSALPE